MVEAGALDAVGQEVFRVLHGWQQNSGVIGENLFAFFDDSNWAKFHRKGRYVKFLSNEEKPLTCVLPWKDFCRC
ncbi:uncharacterized protein BT62DRAFT_552273 [Guyanagaster necrorhizus]|uniref:Uncharacterized protein n=1 Tax=Guyanagaster necrorhizus TaxID=856835 RepID=A0A9P7VHI5_9AGAR|nr:uncharacterized protein BT62DRAFT_552273 [Guyanagaster necrorhizus MCA 3950]KAG7441148.1 hypothetical protein BT62DRAFT_552273 [Guyanagaster necrorhizus MCA 3950]